MNSISIAEAIEGGRTRYTNRVTARPTDVFMTFLDEHRIGYEAAARRRRSPRASHAMLFGMMPPHAEACRANFSRRTDCEAKVVLGSPRLGSRCPTSSSAAIEWSTTPLSLLFFVQQ